jgi:hypothetical protein
MRDLLWAAARPEIGRSIKIGARTRAGSSGVVPPVRSDAEMTAISPASQSNPGRLRRVEVVLAVFALASAVGPVLAADALRFVPSDVAGCLTLSNVSASSRAFVDFAQRLDTDSRAFDLAEFEMAVGFEPGTLDLSQPIHIILSRPEELGVFLRGEGSGDGAEHYPLIAFVPKDGAAFMAKVGGRENRPRRQEGPFGSYHLLMRDGVAFVSEQPKWLHRVKRVVPEGSLAASLSKDIAAMGSSSDIFLHLRMDRWREKISPFVMLAGNLIKLSVASEQEPAQREQVSQLIEWLASGFSEALEQMETVTLSMAFDGETFRVGHHLAFREGAWFADYLSDVRRTGVDLFRGLPDQPFFMAGVFDWKCPPGKSFNCRFSRYFYSLDAAKRTTPKDLRARLVDTAMDCAASLNGSQFMLTSPPGQLQPMQVLTGYAVEDAREVFKKYRFIQENAAELMTSFMPGGAAGKMGRFKECRQDGIEYVELPLDLAGSSETGGEQIALVYGEGARLQQAILDEKQIVFTITQAPHGVVDLTQRLKAGATLGRNKPVRRIRSRLPADANAIVLIDTGRLASAVPLLAQMSLTGARHGWRPRMNAGSGDARPVGPLLAWTCRVRPTALDCQLMMEADDVLEMVRLLGPLVGEKK